MQGFTPTLVTNLFICVIEISIMQFNNIIKTAFAKIIHSNEFNGTSLVVTIEIVCSFFTTSTPKNNYVKLCKFVDCRKYNEN